MQLMLKLTLILCLFAPTTPRGINPKQHPGFIPLGTAVLTRGETKSYKKLRKIGDIENLAACKNEYIAVEPVKPRKSKKGIIRFMVEISAAEETPYGEYYAPVYYSTYTDKHGEVREDVGEIKIIVQETKPTPKHPRATKIFHKVLGITIIVLFCIVGLAMVFYVLVRIAKGTEESDIEAEEMEIEEDDTEKNTDDGNGQN